jgi:uncharacterized Zn-binding protein involved in type VI secretion
MHTCPMATPGTPPVAHFGGPIITGCPTVLIGGQPAARISDQATCIGPPDAVVQGAATVHIGGQPAARMGDMTVHGGVITTGMPTVLIGDPATASSASLALALSLLSAGGSADVSDVALVAQELVKFPPHVLQTMIDEGKSVVVCRGSVTDYRADLRGVQPRGWPEGSTWDSVPGAYMGGTNEVVIATTGHGTPEGAHVPQSGEGHGSHNLVLHECGHAVDDRPGGPARSSEAAFNQARDADSATLSDYETQPGAAGQEETYAESMARHYGEDSNDAADHPNLHDHWASDPLNPNPGGGP